MIEKQRFSALLRVTDGPSIRKVPLDFEIWYSKNFHPCISIGLNCFIKFSIDQCTVMEAFRTETSSIKFLTHFSQTAARLLRTKIIQYFKTVKAFFVGKNPEFVPCIRSKKYEKRFFLGLGHFLETGSSVAAVLFFPSGSRSTFLVILELRSKKFFAFAP